MSPERSRISRHNFWSARSESARLRSSASIRPRISAAALRVNVIARTFAGSTPRLKRLTYRSTRTCVFPVPADASRRTLCDGSTALARAAASGRSKRGREGFSAGAGGKTPPDPFSRSSSNGSQSDVANVILPADRCVCAASAHDCIDGRRRKLSTLDAIDGVEQPDLCGGQRGVSRLPSRQHRNELAVLAERDIAGLSRLPFLAARLP